jgi:hypothetical protein
MSFLTNDYIARNYREIEFYLTMLMSNSKNLTLRLAVRLSQLSLVISGCSHQFSVENIAEKIGENNVSYLLVP